LAHIVYMPIIIMTVFTSSLNSGTLHLQTFAVCCTSFGRLLFATYDIYILCC